MQAELELLLDAELRNEVTVPSKKCPIAILVHYPFFQYQTSVGEQKVGIILRVRLAHAVLAKIQRICAFENFTSKIRRG